MRQLCLTGVETFAFPRCTVLLVCVLVTMAAPLSAPLSAQQSKDAAPLRFDPSLHARASNAAITVTVDRGSGRFTVETVDGRSLLFNRRDGATSYTNIRVEDDVFTGNTLFMPQTQTGTRALPTGSAVSEPDRVRFTSRMYWRGHPVDVRQDFIPSLDSGFAYVRVVTALTNASTRPLTLGAALLFDLYLEHTDLVRMSVEGDTVRRERMWLPPDVPDGCSGRADGSSLELEARLAGNGCDRPDRFVIGRWQFNGYLGAVAWNYTASGLPFFDNAMLLQWNERAVAPGASVQFTTDYGYRARLEAALTCSTDTVRLNATFDGYDPMPAGVTAVLENTGMLPLPSCTIELMLPVTLGFAPGETPIRTVTGPIPRGERRTLRWEVVAPPDTAASSHELRVGLTGPSGLSAKCLTRLNLPAIPRFAPMLVCPDTIAVREDSTGGVSVSAPFDIVAEVVNTGSGVLTAATVDLLLPASLRPESGVTSSAVSPMPLMSGMRGTAAFRVRAVRARRDTTVTYTVTMNALPRGSSSCDGVVRIPAMPSWSCVDNGASTRGTEFMLGFLPNDRGNSGEAMTIVVCAPEDADVRIHRPATGLIETLTLAGGTCGQYVIEPEHDDHPDETPSRRGIRITSTTPVSVVAASLRLAHSDASLVLPTHALGTEYLTVGYNYFDPEEHVLLVSPSNGTIATMTPFSITSRNRPGGVPFDIPLDDAQSSLIRAGVLGAAGGLTGSVISSTSPISVYSGARTGWIPENSRSDYGFLSPHFHQLPPVSALGTEYAAVPFLTRRGGDTWKIVATEDATEVRLGAAAPFLLARRGDASEHILTEPTAIRADKPVLVAQFANSAYWDEPFSDYGDGCMTVLAPSDRWSSCFFVPTGLGGRFDSSFVTITAFSDATSLVRLNGSALADSAFHPIPSSSFSAARMRLASGVHALSTDDRRGIGVIVYGFEYHDAFAYNAGYRVGRSAGVLDVDTPRPGAAALDAPWPNPTTTSTVLGFSLVTDGMVECRLLDALGRTAQILTSGRFAAGSHRLRVSTASLVPGMYTVVLVHAHGTLTRRLVVVR